MGTTAGPVERDWELLWRIAWWQRFGQLGWREFYNPAFQSRFRENAERILRDDLADHASGRRHSSERTPCVLGQDQLRGGPREARHPGRDVMFSQWRMAGVPYEEIAETWSAAAARFDELRGQSIEDRRVPPPRGETRTRLSRLSGLGLPSGELHMFDLGSESAPSAPAQVRKQIDRGIRTALRSAWNEITGMTEAERDEALDSLRDGQAPLEVKTPPD